MARFSLTEIHADYHAVYCNGVKVGIVFPRGAIKPCRSTRTPPCSRI